MLIYNTTYHVAKPLEEIWKQWAKAELLDFMQADMRMCEGQIARVMNSENEQEGVSFSVQFKIADMKTLQDWFADNADGFQKMCTRRFGQDVLYFSTTLELL